MSKPAVNDQIDLVELVQVLWKNVLVIALVAVLVGSGAFAYTAFMVSPQYQATAAMYVNNSAFSLGDTFSISTGELSASNWLVSVYLYILKSRTTMEDVIKEAELTYSPGQLSGMISAKSIASTSAFEVTVTSESPAESELIANTIAKVLPDRISEIVDGTSVRIVDYAIIPAHRSGPDLVKNTVMGILVGGVLSAAVVIVMSLLNIRSRVAIMSVEELRDMYPDIRVLVQVPDMRSNPRNGYYGSYYAQPYEKKEGRKNGKR